jgi:hypothetical protein
MYAKKGKVKKGDILIADDGFTCVKAGEVEIHEDCSGLFFHCRNGHHYLDGQLDDGDVYIGLSKPQKAEVQ